MMTEVKRILLAEDNANDVGLTLTALRVNHLANEVVVARDGAEALDYLYSRGTHVNRPAGRPALVLLDLKMPKVDGLEVVRRMRADAGLREVPVVMLTSSREERDIVMSYQIGVNAYVVKPVAFDEFISAVRNLGLFWAVVNEPPPSSLSRAA